tara:strand:- start:155 stop:844 length:690 start_codon:yes stop_codon:yes gene_type:complete
MYIEFIGFSSSGKTTLIDHFFSKLNKTDINFNSIELSYLNNPYSNNWKSRYISLLIDIKIFLIYFNFSLIRDCNYMLRNTNLSWFRKVNYIRNYIKKKYLLKTCLSKKSNNKVIVADEGDVQSFLNIFVHIKNNVHKYDEYGKLILPDILVYLRPSKQILVNRILKRKNRSQWSKLPLNDLENIIDNFNKKVDLIIDRHSTLKEMQILVFDDKYNKEDISKIIIKNIIY